MRSMLAIVERAHSGTVETLYAEVFHIAYGLGRRIDQFDLLLRGDAVTAALEAPPVPAQAVGGRRVDGLPDCGWSVRLLIANGARVLVDEPDLRALGLADRTLVPDVERTNGASAVRWSGYDAVWFL